MKRIGLALMIGFTIQTAIWFLVPDGKMGSCGPIDTMACIKFSLLLPGMLVTHWLHVPAEEEKISLAVIFLTPSLLYAAIAWIAIMVASVLKRRATV
jgi:hypothetical protein